MTNASVKCWKKDGLGILAYASGASGSAARGRCAAAHRRNRPSVRIRFPRSPEPPYSRAQVDAFELHAVDYLLKPVSQARLEKAIARVRQEPADEGALDRLSGRSWGVPTRFLARKGTTYRVVAAREVLCFVSEEGLTKLQTREHHYWMTPTLNELEARLDPAEFFRISHAAIVHLDAVTEVAAIAGGHGELTLRNGLRLDVSRRRFRDLTDRLGGA